MEFLFLIIGFCLLIKAADFFVDASVKIAHIFHMSEVLIGATIVAVGTTLPETMVSATSSFMGHGDIAFGNAIGSIICNTALVSGLSIYLSPSRISRNVIKFPTIFYFTVFAIYIFNAYVLRSFSRVMGVILVFGFILYSYFMYKNNIKSNVETQKDNTKYNLWLQIGIIIASAFVIAFASRLLIDNGVVIARKFGIPESVIGLTIIAFGTSLPEFVTAVTALLKGHNNLSIGNIIGANLFNLLNVTGLACLIRPFDIPDEKLFIGRNASLVVDIPIALLVMLIFLIPPMVKGKTYRLQGVILLIIYIGYLTIQFKF